LLSTRKRDPFQDPSRIFLFFVGPTGLRGPPQNYSRFSSSPPPEFLFRAAFPPYFDGPICSSDRPSLTREAPPPLFDDELVAPSLSRLLLKPNAVELLPPSARRAALCLVSVTTFRFFPQVLLNQGLTFPACEATLPWRTGSPNIDPLRLSSHVSGRARRRRRGRGLKSVPSGFCLS